MKTSIFYLSCAFMVITNASAINSSLLNSKIIGGHEAAQKSRRFMTSLRVRGSHFCCGFLLTRKIVISTGSCTNFYKLHGGLKFNDSTVYVGIFNIDSVKGKRGIKVERANYHPQYNPEDLKKTNAYDIGYVVLAETLRTWYPISTVPLARNDMRPPFRAETYGWDYDRIDKLTGNNRESHKISVLKKVTFNIISPFTCELALSRNLTAHEYCGTESNTVDTLSKGDIGSPLLKQTSKKVIGLVSHVNGGGQYYPTVFLKTKFFFQYTEGLKEVFPEQEPHGISGQSQPCEFLYTNNEYVQPEHDEGSEVSNGIEECETPRSPGHTGASENTGHSEPLENSGHVESLEHPGHVGPSENLDHTEPSENPGHTVPSEGLGSHEPSECSGHHEVFGVPDSNGDSEIFNNDEPCELAHLYEFYEEPDLSTVLRPPGGTQDVTLN